jgi:hypothetical protein
MVFTGRTGGRRARQARAQVSPATMIANTCMHSSHKAPTCSADHAAGRERKRVIVGPCACWGTPASPSSQTTCSAAQRCMVDGRLSSDVQMTHAHRWCNQIDVTERMPRRRPQNPRSDMQACMSLAISWLVQRHGRISDESHLRCHKSSCSQVVVVIESRCAPLRDGSMTSDSNETASVARDGSAQV